MTYVAHHMPQLCHQALQMVREENDVILSILCTYAQQKL